MRSTVEKIFRSRSESVLVKHIQDALDQGYFLGIIVKGRQQLGKTRYSMRVTNRIYNDWNKTLEHMVFTIPQFIRISMGRKKEIVIWDDAGIHASKYLAYVKELRPLLWLLQQTLDLIGTRINVLIVTTPNIKNLIKPLREYPDWLLVSIKKGPGLWRIARVYQMYETIEGKIKYIHLGDDKYLIHEGIPDWVLDTYYPVRDHWAQMALHNTEQYIKELAEEYPKLATMLQDAGLLQTLQ